MSDSELDDLLKQLHARLGAARSLGDEDRRLLTIAARDISQALALAQSTVVSTAATPGLAQVFAAPSACTLNFGGAGSFASGHLDVVGLDGKVGCTSLATSASPGYAKTVGAKRYAARFFRTPIIQVFLRKRRSRRRSLQWMS